MTTPLSGGRYVRDKETGRRVLVEGPEMPAPEQAAPEADASAMEPANVPGEAGEPVRANRKKGS